MTNRKRKFNPESVAWCSHYLLKLVYRDQRRALCCDWSVQGQQYVTSCSPWMTRTQRKQWKTKVVLKFSCWNVPERSEVLQQNKPEIVAFGWYRRISRLFRWLLSWCNNELTPNKSKSDDNWSFVGLLIGLHVTSTIWKFHATIIVAKITVINEVIAIVKSSFVFCDYKAFWRSRHRKSWCFPL